MSWVDLHSEADYSLGIILQVSMEQLWHRGKEVVL